MRDGDVFIVNGQKIWTSLAQVAKFGILIARTDTETPKYTGISYFIVPMDLPGIEIRPLRNMVGGFGDGGFCEVFFTDVEVPAENLIGPLNGGWAMAKETLANERVSLSRDGLQWGHGPTVRDLLDLLRKRGGVSDLGERQRVVEAYIEGEIMRYHQYRQISAAVNKKPGPDASLRKALKDPHGKNVFGLAKDLMGVQGLLAVEGVEPDWTPWASGFLFSPALTVGGGTAEVLRNIIAERILGLPHDVDVEAGKTWAETHRAEARDAWPTGSSMALTAAASGALGQTDTQVLDSADEVRAEELGLRRAARAAGPAWPAPRRARGSPAGRAGRRGRSADRRHRRRCAGSGRALMSKVNGSSNTSSSRLAEMYQRVTLSPSSICWPSQLEVARGVAPEEHDRRRPAQDLLHRGADQSPGSSTSASYWSGFSRKALSAVADGVAGRLVASHREQQEEHVEVHVRQRVAVDLGLEQVLMMSSRGLLAALARRAVART